MTPALQKIWCDEDEHYRFEHFADFNEWLDSEEWQARASSLNPRYGSIAVRHDRLDSGLRRNDEI